MKKKSTSPYTPLHSGFELTHYAPMPWSTKEANGTLSIVGAMERFGDRQLVCDMPDGPDKAQRAACIVHACNNYSRLMVKLDAAVSALRAVDAFLGECETRLGDMNYVHGSIGENHESPQDIVRAAIKALKA